MITDDQIIDGVIEREGGWEDRPEDGGGPTNFGITLPILSSYLGRAATMADLRALTPATAAPIYRQIFVDEPGFDAIADDSLRALVVDCGVQHGPGTAVRWLQQALNAGGAQLTVDGAFGSKSKAALASADPAAVYRDLLDDRERLYTAIVAARPDQKIFADGWENRLEAFRAQAPA